MSQVSALRAPRENHAVLVHPAFTDLPAHIEANRRLFSTQSLAIFNENWQQVRSLAQCEMQTVCEHYLRQAGEPVPEFSADRSMIVSGHQPELFHPGVWVKNFALNRLARQMSATPINLIVDNDTNKSAGLIFPKMKLPLPPIEEYSPSTVVVPYDQREGEIPLEELTVQDEELFADFGKRAQQDWPFVPLLSTFWPEVLRHADRTALIGERFAAARRTFERDWGCRNGEIPVSRMSETESFGRYVGHLLCHLPRFAAVYNLAVQDYRKRHKIRSRHHPVPNLAHEGDWYEAPFWAWKKGDNRRGRLHVRVRTDTLELQVDGIAWPNLPRSSEIASQFPALATSGYKIRPRALTNTLFARMFVADLFIHGIGGGKYDELTDELIREFYGVKVPSYAVLSATLHLPFPIYETETNDCQELQQQWRDVYWNPQRHLPADSLVQAHVRQLLDKKQALLANMGQTRRERRDRYYEIRRLSDLLRPYTKVQEEALRQRHRRCQEQTAANRILQNRDYSFCLHPEETLRPFCQRFLSVDGC